MTDMSTCGGGWYEVKNPKSKKANDKVYYIHYETKKTAWTLPAEATAGATGEGGESKGEPVEAAKESKGEPVEGTGKG